MCRKDNIMKETVETISEELWEQLKEMLEDKLAEFGIDEVSEEWAKAEVSSKIIVRLENKYLIES